MSRRRLNQDEAFGSDSFLDIVANIVGILIILVIVVGLRVQHVPLPAQVVADETLARLDHARTEVRALESGLVALDERMLELSQEAVLRFEERSRLGVLVAAGQRELKERRAALDHTRREAFDLARLVAGAEDELVELERQRALADEVTTERIEVRAYPTPLSQTVHGQEAHYQIRGGRVAFVPIDELLSLVKSVSKQQMSRLRESSEFSASVGPVGGFRMKYVWERVDVPFDNTAPNARAGTYAQLSEFVVQPVGAKLGEDVATALGPQSEFRLSLSKFDPRRTTVTLWTYPDSFAAYRQIREELYRLGFAAAARPLPAGVPIGGSRDGSRSVAQ